MSNQLATTEQPSILAMMAKLTESGMTTESVSMMTQLVGLHERMEAKAAEKAFAAAFVKLQRDVEGITANKIVPTKSGGVKYRYANYEEIMGVVKPVLFACGFAVSFNTTFTGFGPERTATSYAKLTHEAGHSQTGEFSCRVISGGPNDGSARDTDCGASSVAQRYALCKMLNIVIETDDDAGAQDSKTISFDDATKLRERLLAAGGDEAAFLLHIKEESFGSIPETKLEFAEGCVRKKERASK